MFLEIVSSDPHVADEEMETQGFISLLEVSSAAVGLEPGHAQVLSHTLSSAF